jgi:hypothetical protein
VQSIWIVSCVPSAAHNCCIVAMCGRLVPHSRADTCDWELPISSPRSSCDIFRLVRYRLMNADKSLANRFRLSAAHSLSTCLSIVVTQRFYHPPSMRLTCCQIDGPGSARPPISPYIITDAGVSAGHEGSPRALVGLLPPHRRWSAIEPTGRAASAGHGVSIPRYGSSFGACPVNAMCQ